MNAPDGPRRDPGAGSGTDGVERAALVAALDALAEAVGAAHDRLRSASPATHALIEEHESWAEHFLWTDGDQVAKAARRIAALLRRYPDPPGDAAPTRRRRRRSRGR